MTSLLPRAGEHTARCEVTTARADARRAEILVRGSLQPAVLPLLVSIVESHLAAGRRYLRVDVTGVGPVEPAVVTEFGRLHHRILRTRGTLVFTGVGPQLARVLTGAAADPELFTVGEFARPLHEVGLPVPLTT